MMTDPGNTIILCGIVTAGTVMVSDVTKGKYTIKPVVTGFLLTGALLIFATFAGDLARGLAIISMVTAVLMNGVPLFNTIGKLGGKTNG